jgi:hypothetical protein
MNNTPLIIIDLAHSKGFQNFKSTTYFLDPRHTVFGCIRPHTLPPACYNRAEIRFILKDDRSSTEVSDLGREIQLRALGNGAFRQKLTFD